MYQASKYTDRTGKSIEVSHDSHTAATVRTLPRERVENHTTIVKNYYGSNRFPHDYDWYYSRPYVHVGCGYSSLFWWTLLDLDMHQRALWMYNNESLFMSGQLNRSLYDEQMQNAQLRAEVDRLRAQKMQQQVGYLPPQFADNPDLALDSDYVLAAHPGNGWHAFGVFCLWALGFVLLCGIGFVVIYLVFVKRW